jgi:pantothenate kinase
MDGFHRSDAELADLGLLALKGVPDSFDATGFLDKLADVRTGEDVVWPTFDRRREVVVPDGRLIDAATRLVVVEGNYLLLDASPWDRVRGHLDTVWYLDVPEDVLIPRLRVRHERRRTPEDAWAKVRSTDLPNAALVADTRSRADVIIAMR